MHLSTCNIYLILHWTSMFCLQIWWNRPGLVLTLFSLVASRFSSWQLLWLCSMLSGSSGGPRKLFKVVHQSPQEHRVIISFIRTGLTDSKRNCFQRFWPAASRSVVKLIKQFTWLFSQKLNGFILMNKPILWEGVGQTPCSPFPGSTPVLLDVVIFTNRVLTSVNSWQKITVSPLTRLHSNYQNNAYRQWELHVEHTCCVHPWAWEVSFFWLV